MRLATSLACQSILDFHTSRGVWPTLCAAHLAFRSCPAPHTSSCVRPILQHVFSCVLSPHDDEARALKFLESRKIPEQEFRKDRNKAQRRPIDNTPALNLCARRAHGLAASDMLTMAKILGGDAHDVPMLLHDRPKMERVEPSKRASLKKRTKENCTHAQTRAGKWEVRLCRAARDRPEGKNEVRRKVVLKTDKEAPTTNRTERVELQRKKRN